MTDTAAFQSVDRRSIAVWRWEIVPLCFLVLVMTGVPVFASRLPFEFGVGIAVAVLAVTLPMAWRYPVAKYRRLSYCLDEAGITIREGVFWRSESSVARIRIQHTDVYQGPLQRHYGVATLKLYTAGSSFTKIELPGLSHSVATALRDELQREGNDDAV